MNAAFCLHFAGIFLSYFLQVAMAYGACCLLSRLLSRPQHRFFLWMLFLLGAGSYWLGLLGWQLRGFTSGAANGSAPAAKASTWAHSFLVPVLWSHDVLIGGEVIGLAYFGAAVLLLGVVAWRHFQLRLVLRRAIEPSPA